MYHIILNYIYYIISYYKFRKNRRFRTSSARKVKAKRARFAEFGPENEYSRVICFRECKSISIIVDEFILDESRKVSKQRSKDRICTIRLKRDLFLSRFSYSDETDDFYFGISSLPSVITFAAPGSSITKIRQLDHNILDLVRHLPRLWNTVRRARIQRTKDFERACQMLARTIQRDITRKRNGETPKWPGFDEGFESTRRETETRWHVERETERERERERTAHGCCPATGSDTMGIENRK